MKCLESKITRDTDFCMAAFLSLSLFFSLFSADAVAKCSGPDTKRISWSREIDSRTLPAGIEIFDRVWLKNPTTTELVTFTADGKTPRTKLVNGERFEFHPSAGGWIRQDYSAGLVEPSRPVLPEKIETRLFMELEKKFSIKVPVPITYGGKRGAIHILYVFQKNPKFGVTDPSCAPSPTPSVTP